MPDMDAVRLEAGLILSRLFLDTDTADEVALMSADLARLQLSVDEMEDLLTHRVYPACRLNLWSTAGVWSGFDPEWLSSRLKNQHGSFMRLIYGYFGRRFSNKCEPWQEIKARIGSRTNDS